MCTNYIPLLSNNIEEVQVKNKGSGYRGKTDSTCDNVYNNKKMNQFALDLSVIMRMIPNMSEFKKLKKEEQNELAMKLARRSLHAVSREIRRLLNINSKFITTKYMHDLFMFYSFYYKFLYHL